MSSWLRDLRLAIRGLGQSPIFTLVTVVTIGLGIGATSTIISAANGLLLRSPAGVRDADRLVTAHAKSRDGSSFHAFSAPDFRDYRSAAAEHVDLAAWSTFPASLRSIGDPVLRMGMVVSGNYLSVLGTRPLLGRLFVPDDDRPGAAPVAVLTETAWRTQFAADSAMIGRALSLNGHPVTVVGVAEPGFHGHLAPLDVSVFLPLSQAGLTGESAQLDERRASWLEVVGRLAPGATREAVGSELSNLATTIGRANGLEVDRQVDVRAFHPIPAQAALPIVGFFGLLLVLAGVVLLIVCVNVASVLLARAVSRRKEIAVRLALGASRARLLQQLVTESLLLFLLGGGLGLALAELATGALTRAPLPIPVPLALDFHLDGPVLAITFLIALATGVLVGLIPARQAGRTDLVRGLKNEAATTAGGKLGLRSVFVVAQVAASVVLLVAAGLMTRALGAASSVNIGFEPAGVHAASFELQVMAWTPDQVARFGETLLERARALPGVRSAGLTDLLPLTLSNQGTGVSVPDRAQEPNVGLFATDFTDVSPGFFQTMGIPLVRGRAFAATDRAGAPVVVIVNQTLAHQIWGNDDPVGKPLGYGGFKTTTPVTVIGVARDAKYRSVGEDPIPMVYVPLAQTTRNALSLLIAGDGRDLTGPVRDLVHSIAPDLPLAANAPLEQMTSIALLPNRIAAGLAGAFGVVGLLLAAIGLYGVLAYGVSLRRRELGIRLALGARESAVRRLVLRDGLRLTVVGLAVGMALAAGLGQLLRSLLYGVSPLDPVTFAGIAALLLGVAFLAADAPARRAARTEPLEALRGD